MFEEGAEIDPMMKERFMAAGKKSTTPKQLPITDQGLNSLQQLQNQVCVNTSTIFCCCVGLKRSQNVLS